MGSKIRESHLYALHGFLGLPQDWDFLHSIPLHLHPISLTEFTAPSLEGWAQRFNQHIEQQPSPFNLLLGYSLGGRLALHTLLDASHPWQGAVIVSAHPGLKTAEEQKQRLEHDRQWAKRVLEEPWDPLLHAWNSQAVFQGHQMAPRQEKDFCRHTLSQQLIHYSLGSQKDLREEIANLSIPILWIFGACDDTYRKLAEEISLQHPLSNKWEAPKAAHRVPWEAPLDFKNKIHEFINTLHEVTYANRTNPTLA